MLIDIGGTPANILESNKLRIARLNKVDSDQLVAIVDPFDLSRIERKLVLGDYKIQAIKFPARVSDTSLNSEYVESPSLDDCRRLLAAAKSKVLGKVQSTYGKRIDLKDVEDRYETFLKDVERVAVGSSNLREFMNGLINLLTPDLRIIKLEDILTENSDKVRALLEKVDIPVRAICPRCNLFVNMSLKEKTSCCEISGEEIINSGKYIPQEGFLPVITYLCGYQTYSNSEEKKQQVQEIMRNIRIEGNPLKSYEKPKKEMTMFESFLLGGQNET